MQKTSFTWRVAGSKANRQSRHKWTSVVDMSAERLSTFDGYFVLKMRGQIGLLGHRHLR